MSEKTVVVALGHRALGTTLPEQKTAARLQPRQSQTWLKREPAW